MKFLISVSKMFLIAIMMANKIRYIGYNFNYDLDQKIKSMVVLHGLTNARNYCQCDKLTVRTFLMTVTCPRYPAVPLSIKGMSAAKHIRLT